MIQLVVGSVLIAVAVLTGCSNSLFDNVSSDSVRATSGEEVTLENYRDKKIMIAVPPGNRNPLLSWSSLYDMMPGEAVVKITEADGSETTLKASSSTKKNFEKWAKDPAGLKVELDRRFTRTMRSILKDKGLKDELVAAAKAHGIDPVLVLACVVGENTFNVGLLDDVQQLAVLATKWAAKWALKFKSNDTDLTQLIKRVEFEVCAAPMRAGGSHADYWNCVGRVWNTKFMGKTIEGVKYAPHAFKTAFFNPLSTGYSYGMGQLDPIRALMVADVVHQKSGLRLLTIDRPEEIYEDIISQRPTAHYVAANVRLMIDTYKKGANFDISQNPGVIASLYNLGGENGRAGNLYKKNLIGLKAGTLTLPMENYYGFYINEKETLMREAFARWAL